jgi:cold shock protein
MNFRDKWVKDADGNEFVFTVEMQRRLSEAGLPVEPAALDQLKQAPTASYERREPRPESRPQGRPQERPSDRFQERERPSSRAQEEEGPASIQIDPQTGKYIGQVKWYNARKGYGFIMRGAGEEIFFHKSGSVGDPLELAEGQWILYDVEETQKGPEAAEVEPFDGPPLD